MSGTVAAAARAALVGSESVLAGLAGLAGVSVCYSMPRDIPRELVVGDDVAGTVKLSAMKAGSRIKREEDLATNIHIRVNEPGSDTTQATDARAVVISTAIEEYIAANPTLGGVTSLLLATVESINLGGFLEDEGATSVLTLRIGLKSFLS